MRDIGKVGSLGAQSALQGDSGRVALQELHWCDGSHCLARGVSHDEVERGMHHWIIVRWEGRDLPGAHDGGEPDQVQDQSTAGLVGMPVWWQWLLGPRRRCRLGGGKYDWEDLGSGEPHEVSMNCCFGQSFARHQGNAAGSAALGVKERCADGGF